MVINSPSFCLSGNITHFPSFWKTVLPEPEFTVDRVWLFYFFTSLHVSSHDLLACRVSAEKYTENLSEDPYMWWIPFLCCIQDSLFVFGFSPFDYIVSQCGSLVVLFYWDFIEVLIRACLSSNLGSFQPPLFLQISFVSLSLCVILWGLPQWIYRST